jgi:plasmid stability protein
MREEMEKEHRMLMGEVWQEERGPMKLALQAEIGREREIGRGRESDDDRRRTRSVRLD